MKKQFYISHIFTGHILRKLWKVYYYILNLNFMKWLNFRDYMNIYDLRNLEIFKRDSVIILLS